ncbi:unnamed protein product [Vicia faba]|uniref:RRM domain-containing protein n=1 Tax=Vicia faba TaxID=3906 RepID=A0AAV0ZB88_VICFA|nr:unnamed protein product [Vicia faba]
MAQVHESSNNDATAPVPNHLTTTSLYIGDLDHDVNDSQIYDLFNQIGHVVSGNVMGEKGPIEENNVNEEGNADMAKKKEVRRSNRIKGKHPRWTQFVSE